MSRPYVVWTPPYDSTSGGLKVIYQFAHELNLRGQKAYITNRGSPWGTPHCDDEPLTDIIAVYPEITWDNPLEGKTVVRYLLNNAGKLRGPTSYPESDILFAQSQMFNDFNLPDDRIMFLPVLDTDIFYDPKLPRDKTAYYIGKGWRSSFLEETQNSLPLYREHSHDQNNLRNILNTCSLLYCYDNITAMTEIARLCGCPVLLIPNGEYTKEQYNKHEMGWDGLGWGEVPKPFDSEKFREHYLGLKDLFYERLDNFIEITQNS